MPAFWTNDVDESGFDPPNNKIASDVFFDGSVLCGIFQDGTPFSVKGTLVRDNMANPDMVAAAGIFEGELETESDIFRVQVIFEDDWAYVCEIPIAIDMENGLVPTDVCSSYLVLEDGEYERTFLVREPGSPWSTGPDGLWGRINRTLFRYG